MKGTKISRNEAMTVTQNVDMRTTSRTVSSGKVKSTKVGSMRNADSGKKVGMTDTSAEATSKGDLVIVNDSKAL
jgi:hypothetical protein